MRGNSGNSTTSISDSLYLPLSSVGESSSLSFATNQVKDHNMLSVEVTCR